MFRIIRAGAGFDPVILVTPADAGPDTPGAKCYRLASWQIGDHSPGVFNEISPEGAACYFGGQADGLGFEEPPEETFPTLEDALRFATKKHRAAVDAMIAEAASRGNDDDSGTDEEARARLRAALIMHGLGPNGPNRIK